MQELLEKLAQCVPEMHRLMYQLVAQNSYTRNVAGVNAVGAMLEQAFALPGLTLRRQPGGEGTGDHLFWSTPAAAAGYVVLVGHHDTVFPPGHFDAWREQDGRAHGPGCLDMKGGLALIWGVLKVLADAGMLAEVPLVLACVADEETGSLDAKAHLQALARGARAALVFEAGRKHDAIITRRRGVAGVRVVATGRAAHAGNAHHEGKNAIWTLARFVDAAQALTDYERGLTLNVGLISGGTSANTVPERAEATIDIRFEDTHAAQELLTRLREVAERVALPGTHLELLGGIKRPALARTPESAALCESYARCQQLAGLGCEEAGIIGGGSDANTLASAGVPAIDGLGPRGSGFHTTEEYAELASFKPKAEALLRWLLTELPRA
jgi:glutamate carboxypeptidase